MLAGFRLELTDRRGTVLAQGGDLESGDLDGKHVRVRSVPCGEGFVMRAIARERCSSRGSAARGILVAALPIALAIGMALGGIHRELRPLDDLNRPPRA